MRLPRDIISAVELASVTAETALVQLIGLCRIGRNTPADAGSGIADHWAEIAKDVPCRLFKARSTRESQLGGAVRSTTLFNLQLTLGTDIAPGDQVEKDGLVYEVMDTDAGTDYAVYLTAFLSRVRSSTIDW